MKSFCFAFAACLISALHLGCNQSPSSTPPERASTLPAAKGNELLTVAKDGDSNSNNIGIATFPTPSGWLPNRSGGNTAVVFLRNGAQQASPDEMISIDIGTPSSEGVKESADSLAIKFGGVVSELPFTIDGEVAYKVTVPPNYEQLLPRECIVSHHNDKACFIFGGSKSKEEIWPTVLEIAKSWRWN